jgi:hypothetical protein
MSANPRNARSNAVPRRLDALAASLLSRARTLRNTEPELATLLESDSSAITELARECAEEHVHAHGDGEIPTPAQGIALARLIRRQSAAPATQLPFTVIALGRANAIDDTVWVRFADGSERCIDREGRVAR